MAPQSSLTALLHSPAASSNGSTIQGNARTLPDISLGSLGSSFRSEDQEQEQQRARPPASLSPDTLDSASLTTPSPPRYPSALTSLSPPTTVRRSSSSSALPGSHAPRRSRILRKASSSSADSDDTDITGPLEARYDDSDDGILNTLSMNISPRKGGVPSKAPYHGGPSRRGGRHSVAGGSGGEMGGGAMTLREQEKELDSVKKDNFNLQLENHFLKERLQNMAPGHIEAALKENVKLKLEILNLSKEMKKSKKLLMQQDRDLLDAQRERDNRGMVRNGDSKEMENLYRLEKQKRKAAEEEQRRLEDELNNRPEEHRADDAEEVDRLRAALEDTEASETIYKDRAEALEDELENARSAIEELAEEIERLKEELAEKTKLGESIGIGKGREARLTQRVSEMEQDNASLQNELQVIQQGSKARDAEREDLLSQIDGLNKKMEKLVERDRDSRRSMSRAKEVEKEADLLEDNINELRDKLAAASLDLDTRDREIDELNNEIDAKIRDHEKEIQQVEAEWRDEVLEARAQVDELKDALQDREQDMKDLREALIEREDELAVAKDRVVELQAAQGETHDRLEETLKNIERDNMEKDADLVAANREVEDLGQRVYELEEAIEELRIREQDLNADLKGADEAFETSQTHYENLVKALKEKISKHTNEITDLRTIHESTKSDLDAHRREVDSLARQAAEHESRHRASNEVKRKMLEERDDLLERLSGEEERGREEREAWKRQREEEAERMARLVKDRDTVNAKLSADLETTRDRLALKDRDLMSVQNALRSLEDERRKLGDEHTSDRFSLELELDRLKRDLERCEEDLERYREDLDARDEVLRAREVDLAGMISKERDLQSKLASERQGRLNLSEKYDSAIKTAKQHERDSARLRDRIEELEPLLTETQSERMQLQKQGEQQRLERSELLLRVFKDVNKFLGAEDHATPANFGVFRDTLLLRLRSMNQVRSDFEKRVKETESSVEQRMTSLKKQLEQKWRALDNFEASVKKLEMTRMQWRSKYSIKDGELESAKARNTELASLLASSKAGSSTDSSTQLRSLTERAQAAEKRAVTASNQLAMLEARIAEMQAKAGQAENKWEARVKEYENRLRIAGEKIKTEKQGGKERAAQLEAQNRELERQLDEVRRKNRRAEGLVANANHLGV
ncbi:hypothetical protein P7C73_g2352, partial [Tremellales sp. Uapishka_1]